MKNNQSYQDTTLRKNEDMKETGMDSKNQFADVKIIIERLMDKNYEDFVKSLVSIELGIEDKDTIDNIYDNFIEDDSATAIISEKFQNDINNDIEVEKDTVNLVGNVIDSPNLLKTKINGEEVEIANFSLVTKNKNTNQKEYHNISAYGDKVDQVRNYQKGDFVSIFGKKKINISSKGKKFENINVLKSKMLKEIKKEEVKEAKETEKIKIKNEIER